MPSVSALAATPDAVASGPSDVGADLLAGLGVAYITYIGQWSHLLTLENADLFWLKTPPAPMRYVALILSNGLLGLLVFAAMRAARSRSRMRTAGRVMVCLFAALSINSLRDLLAGYYPDEFGGNVLRSISVAEAWGAALLLLGVLFVLGIKYMQSAIIACIHSALIGVSVLGFWNMAKAAYQAGGFDAMVFAAPANAAFLPAAPTAAPKVVWLVFDELDYRLAFVDRRQDVSTPNLNAFQQTAVSASQAYPPSNATSNSILTYLLGEKVVKLRPAGSDDLNVRTAEHPESRRWKQLPNLFSEARQAGANGAIVGWYLPYGKLVGSDVVDCWWFDKSPRDAAIGNSLPAMLLNQPRALLETSLLSPFGQSLLTKQRVVLFDEFMAKTRQLLDDSRVGLLLLHVPVPHTPYFYDRRTGHNTLANSSIDGYWDALALVDRILGDVKTELTASGAWDNSVIMIGSDHYYRTAMRVDGRMDTRVPFLVKMPGQKQAAAFNKPFNTQLSHDLVLDILRGKVRTGEQAVNWLEKSHSSVAVGWGVH